jgi:phage terminase large subunit
MTETAEIIFNTNGNTKQRQAAIAWTDNSKTDIVYGGGKGGGKSYLGCSLIFGDALMYPETYYFIARKELNDLRRFTIPSIHEVFNNLGLDPLIYLKWHGEDNYFELPNRSKVFLLSAKYLPGDPQYQRFGSMQMTRGWIEEAGEFASAAKANLQASIGRWKNDDYGLVPKLLQTCNPSKNYLYIDYYKPFKTGKLDSWKAFIQALPQDNKKLPPGYIESLTRTLSSREKSRLIYGNWEYDDDPSALMDYDSITSIFTNTHVQPSGKRFMSVDVARFGNDKSILRVWDGLRVVHVERLEKKSTREVADEIKRLSMLYQIPPSQIIIDEDGIGGGVVDNFPRNSVKGFIANSKPINLKPNENYENLKAQCAYILADKVKKKEIYDCESNPEYQEMIIEDLEQIKEKDTDSQGKRGIIPKDQVKEVLGRSPDEGDTYIMRMFFEVNRPMGLRVI